VGWEIPPVFLALPGPLLYIVLAILGITLWSGITDEYVVIAWRGERKTDCFDYIIVQTHFVIALQETL